MFDKKEAYLGDGVYASFDGYQIWLTTKRAWHQEDDKIALEPQVFEDLLRYAKSLGWKYL